ncbi:hypothetical protein JCM8097_001191 [Rhodosporidiobolus ruineniae]
MATPLPLPAHTPAALHPGVLTLPALLPSPSSPPPKRADVVSLKLRLAALLAPGKAQLYWAALGEFMVGRVTRSELDEAMSSAFKGDHRSEATKLHNALILSILYNTTRPFLPPSSVRHSGFHPRGAKKRGALGVAGEDDDAASRKRRRLLKSVVMALGRRERAELKLLGAGGNGGATAAASSKKGKPAGDDEERRRQRREQFRISEAVGGTSMGGASDLEPDGLPRLLKQKERDGVQLPSSLAQDYKRLAQTPLCCESRLLPDSETLRDRMLGLAFEDGLIEGVEGRAATLLHDAVEHHLTAMIASVISLVRGTLPAVPTPRTTASANNSAASTPTPLPSSTFAPAGSAPTPKQALRPPLSPSPTGEQTAPDADVELHERLPLTIGDFHALFAISPGLLGQYPNVGAVERMYAIPPPDDDSSDEESDQEQVAHEQARSTLQQDAVRAKRAGEEDTIMLDAPPPNAGPAKPPHPAVASLAGPSSTTSAGEGVRAGKQPRLSRSRASSFYGAKRPVPTSHPSTTDANGKARFVLDPSSLHGVPEGHPDVPHLIATPQPLSTAMFSGMAGSSGATPAPPAALDAGVPGAASGLSPKSLSLRNALFPELAASGAAGGTSSGAQTPAGAAAGATGGDGNGTTDAGESDTEDEAHAQPGTASAAGGGLKIKLGSAASGQAGPAGQRASVSGVAGPPQTTNERDREAGRKLWEVVDSVGLLDGVLQ